MCFIDHSPKELTMKKQIYLLVLIAANLLFAKSLVAQSGIPEISVVAGVTGCTIFGDSDSWKGAIGTQGGAIVNIIDLNDKMSILAELNISLQGARWEEDWGEGLTKGRTSLIYANIPIIFRYMVESGLFGEAGIQPGILLSAKDKYDDVSYDYKEYISKFDLGVFVGAGYFFPNNFGVNIRVIPGLLNVNSGDYDNWTDHNLVVALRVMYTINKK